MDRKRSQKTFCLISEQAKSNTLGVPRPGASVARIRCAVLSREQPGLNEWVCGQSGIGARDAEKISQAAINIAAITGPITKPLSPKIAMPPRVAISTT
jgi:hypothetical protein